MYVERFVFLALLLAAPSVTQVRVEGHGAAKRFISENYGFSMAVPVGWGVSIGLDTPVYFHAPSGERFVQASIPKEGAVIRTQSHDKVFGLSKSVATPEAWALADASAAASSIPPIKPLQFPMESGVSHAVTCSYDEPTFSPDQRTQHSVAVFWDFGQKLFAAHLNYNAHDSKEPAFEKVFFQTVRSIRPLDKYNEPLGHRANRRKKLLGSH